MGEVGADQAHIFVQLFYCIYQIIYIVEREIFMPNFILRCFRLVFIAIELYERAPCEIVFSP